MHLIIAESHLSLHAFPGGRMYIDAFSCVPFQEEYAVVQTVTFLGLKEERHRVQRDRLAGVMKGG